MFSVFLSNYQNTRESLGELEKAVETLACSSRSRSISRSPKLPVVWSYLHRDTVHVFYFLSSRELCSGLSFWLRWHLLCLRLHYSRSIRRSYDTPCPGAENWAQKRYLELRVGCRFGLSRWWPQCTCYIYCWRTSVVEERRSGDSCYAAELWYDTKQIKKTPEINMTSYSNARNMVVIIDHIQILGKGPGASLQIRLTQRICSNALT